MGSQTPLYGEREDGTYMFTISDILEDINRGILANNMIETCFSYQIVYFVNSESGGEKHYTDTSYDGLRTELENIIRGNLTTTNVVVIAAVSVWKNGKTVSLLDKVYRFNLDEYFQRINGKKERNRICSYYSQSI